MEESKGQKRKLEKSSSDEESDKSVKSFIYVGNVGNTMSDSSSGEENHMCERSRKRKKMKISSDKEEESSDCQITGYDTPPKSASDTKEDRLKLPIPRVFLYREFLSTETGKWILWLFVTLKTETCF